jgi:hypothetical protein
MSDKDKLEQFIIENRTSFDTNEVPEGIWDRIEGDLSSSRQKTMPVLWYWKAAVVVLLVAVTFLVADNYLPSEAPPLSEITEFEELETFYTSIINKKETKLQVALEGEDAINFLESDIEELELLYNDLRKVYLEEQTTPEVYGRLMHLLRQRIHLINAQLDIIAKSKVPTEREVILN